MDESNSLLQNLDSFPDCKEKRTLENLGQKIELLMDELSVSGVAGEQNIHNQLNETWWKANAVMGTLVEKTVKENKMDRR